jgi:ketosteroid isomerase-like protein
LAEPGSQRSVIETVHEGMARWSRGDLDGALELAHPDMRFETSGLFIGSARVYEGAEGVRAYWADILEVWDSLTMEPLEAIQLDENRVLTSVRFCGRGSQSGIESEAIAAGIWTLRDGLLSRYQGFASKEDALAAAGIGDQS